MQKVITDKKRIKEILERGVEKIYPNKELLEKVLLSGKRIRLYCGYDPSATSLHIGNAISINKMAQFQELGHEVIFLIGDFTGMIGDPTDKLATRKKMTRDEVLSNSKLYKQQASAYLKFDGENSAKIRYNSEWSDKMTFKDLIELSSNFTVQQMIVRDMFRKRIKEDKPIYLHEFLYPLAQGYDSVAMDIDLEIGGNDQMFNMMAGRDLQKAVNNKEKFVMTLKLLADDKGKKMGKSEGNAVFLNETPENMYGIIMSWPDGVINIAFELCTKLSLEEVNKIKIELKNNANPRDFKMKLAYEIIKINYNSDIADKAQNYFIKTVQKKEIPNDIKEINIKNKSINIIELLVKSKLVNSKGEARRLIKQNAIKIDGKIIDDDKFNVELLKKIIILQKGKRGFVKVSR